MVELIINIPERLTNRSTGRYLFQSLPPPKRAASVAPVNSVVRPLMKRAVISITGILSFFAPIYCAFVFLLYIPNYMNFNPTLPLAGDSIVDLIFKAGCSISFFTLIAYSIMLGTIVHDKTLSRDNRFKFLFALIVFNVIAMPIIWYVHFRHKFSVDK